MGKPGRSGKLSWDLAFLVAVGRDVNCKICQSHHRQAQGFTQPASVQCPHSPPPPLRNGGATVQNVSLPKQQCFAYRKTPTKRVTRLLAALLEFSNKKSKLPGDTRVQARQGDITDAREITLNSHKVQRGYELWRERCAEWCRGSLPLAVGPVRTKKGVPGDGDALLFL